MSDLSAATDKEMTSINNFSPVLMQGNCLDLLEKIPENSVNTVITSPPYAKQRNYCGASSVDYIEFLSPIMRELKRVIDRDGNIFINIKEHCRNGERDLYVFKMVIHFVEDLGLKFIDEFIWNKTNPFPTGAKTRLKDGYERVLHFTKEKGHKFKPNNVLIRSTSKWLESEKRRKNKGAHDVTNDSGMNMSKRVATDMVRPSNVITGTSSNENIGHPAVYPTYLPEFFIKLTTSENDCILDPFMGSGTTGIACANLNRRFIGIELNRDYLDIAKDRIAVASCAGFTLGNKRGEL